MQTASENGSGKQKNRSADASLLQRILNFSFPFSASQITFLSHSENLSHFAMLHEQITITSYPGCHGKQINGHGQIQTGPVILWTTQENGHEISISFRAKTI